MDLLPIIQFGIAIQKNVFKMQKIKTGTLFSGTGTVDCVLRDLNLKLNLAVEYDHEIAEIYALNHGSQHLRVHPVEELVNPPELDFLWYSPVCDNASDANPSKAEQVEDLTAIEAVLKLHRDRAPLVSVCENVWAYRKFESFKRLVKGLQELGYWVSLDAKDEPWKLNAADYGSPQTRIRLFLVASRIGEIKKPQPTHSKNPESELLPWEGWYNAIADLIPTLPYYVPHLDTEGNWIQGQWCQSRDKYGNNSIFPLFDKKFKGLADWQVSRWRSHFETKQGLHKVSLLDSKNSGRPITVRSGCEPSFTVIADGASSHRARVALIERVGTSSGKLYAINPNTPSHTIRSFGRGCDRQWHKHDCVIFNDSESFDELIKGVKVFPLDALCLARLMGLKDFKFPQRSEIRQSASIDAEVIGNGVCYQVARAIMLQVLSAIV